MCGRGFIFSLDAFVAFTLTMVTISLLAFTIGTPQAPYSSLEQASLLAHDALAALATTSQSGSPPYYLEQAIGDSGLGTGQTMRRVVGGMVPPGFGYNLSTYDFSSGAWVTVYDSANDALSGRFGKAFTRLSASASVFTSFYSVEPIRGESPYCYLTCKGYNGTGPDGIPEYAPVCGATPCDLPASSFQRGQNSVQLVRLAVYT